MVLCTRYFFYIYSWMHCILIVTFFWYLFFFLLCPGSCKTAKGPVTQDTIIIISHIQAVLPDGNEVAAKRLFLNTKQCVDQFFNEVDVISQVRHKNLVKLLGCSIDGPESFLIYEYHFNKSLDLSIFGKSKTQFIIVS